MSVKIHICYKTTERPWGGGNQFLKALRDYFISQGIYADDPRYANVILVNSHHFYNVRFLRRLAQLKRKYGAVVVHRVDGPLFLVRGSSKEIDDLISRFNNLFADGTVFQSNWSKQKNFEMQMDSTPYQTVISNAPDSSLFNSVHKKNFDYGKIKLIASSWSSN